MAYNRNPKRSKYLAMTKEERLNMATQSGSRKVTELIQVDSVLAEVMRTKGENVDFLFEVNNYRRSDQYKNMSNDELVSFATDMAKRNGLSRQTDIKKDESLYNELKVRKLTRVVATKAGLRWEGRNKNLKMDKPRTSQENQYRKMRNSELFNAIKATGADTSRKLQKMNFLLSKVLKDRPSVRERMTELGWRRAHRQWDEMTLNDWMKLCSEFCNPGDFQNNYTSGYTHALKSGMWPEIKKKMVQSGRWKTLTGFDGRKYDSRAEMIVANWMFISGISYESHPRLPWKKNRRHRQADFKLNGKDLYIEVFLGSEAGLKKRKDSPSWAPNYLKKRQAKERMYQEMRLPLITIEAEIYRKQGITGFLPHIRKKLAEHNVVLANPRHKKLDIGMDSRGYRWTQEEFFKYAIKNNLTKLSDFQKKGHSDLYRILEHRNMRDDLRRKLDQHHGRKTEAEGKFLLPLEKIKEACKELRISSKPAYEKAYKEGQLPFGAPSSILQSYGVHWNVFFRGKKRTDFWSFEKARAFVRQRQFKSRSEFAKAVQTDPEMKYIRRDPNNKVSGGYPDFTNWADFLGKKK